MAFRIRMGLPEMDALLREIRGPFFRSIDPRFIWIMLISLGLHVGLIVYFNVIKKPPKPTMDIEAIPERFAKLIIEKPLPMPPNRAPSDCQRDITIASRAGSGAAPPPTRPSQRPIAP